MMKMYVEVGIYYDNFAELRKRWESFGELISGNAMSEPFTFSLPSDPKFDTCK
jgi:hypothetical protein